MRNWLIHIFILSVCFFKAQTYPNQNINLLSLIHPNSGTVGIGPDDRRYNGCWGWYQSNLNKEYAIVGSSSGTYFIDVTIPTTPSVSAFVPGVQGVTVREVKTYQNYCYITCDEPTANTFQIVDMSTLPNTVTVVHNSNSIISRGHTQWINQDKLYIANVTYSDNTTSSMNIYSLATPSAPVLLRELKQDFPSITSMHDMYVRNDTVFASGGYQGLFVFKFNSTTNTFTQLGSYTGYASGTFNHSSCLTQNGKYLLFCDEGPAGSPIRFVDVENLSNIQPVQTFQPYATTTAHNPFLIGNKLAVIACYQEGLYIYNISQPGNAVIAGYFDTFPQGGGNTGNYNGQPYRGNWGAYPYLPSGIIIAADMQNGVFILDPTNAYNTTIGLKKYGSENNNLIVFPNPASNKVSVNYSGLNPFKIELRNIFGELVFENSFPNSMSETIDISFLKNGSYILSVNENGKTNS